jgi:pseudaminic acid cytidylyltransferase
MNVAIIPAREGNIRIPGKNTKLFMGKPIIKYSIEAAIQSNLFDRVVVSTDSEIIAQVARDAGAETPFIRPKDLADEFSPLADVFFHAMMWLKNLGDNIKYACGILATAPFIRTEDIKSGYKLLLKKQVSSVCSVATFPFPISRALKINNDGYLEMFWPEHELTRSNDLPQAYHDAGQFYWLESEEFLKKKKVYTPDALPVIIPRYLVQDIDTLEDWEVAERMYKSLQLNSDT